MPDQPASPAAPPQGRAIQVRYETPAAKVARTPMTCSAASATRETTAKATTPETTPETNDSRMLRTIATAIPGEMSENRSPAAVGACDGHRDAQGL